MIWSVMARRLRSLYTGLVPGILRPRSTRHPQRKLFERCVLHIGTEKTGTSSIQHFLAKNRDAFAADGVVYSRSTGTKGGSQWGFVACAHPRAWATDIGPFLGFATEEGRDAYCERFVRDLQAEFDRARGATTLVVSSEHMHSRLIDVDLITRLKAFLDPWVDRFEVVLYLRRQDRVSAALYATQVKSGNPEPRFFPPMPGGVIRYYFDYDAIYDNWSTVFGADAIRVGLFAPANWQDGDLITDFCARAGLDISGKQRPEAWLNTGLDRIGSQFLTEVNRQLPTLIGHERNRERTDLANLISRLCGGRHVPATRRQAEEFQALFAEANDRLRRKIFPDRPGSLFDDDFHEYPEAIEAIEPRYEDAVALAIRLWREARATPPRRPNPPGSGSVG